MSKLWFEKFFKGFYYATRGIVEGFKERNMRVHGFMAFLVIVMGWFLGLTRIEWYIVFILMALVLGAELFNSSIEELANVVKKKNKCEYEETRTTRDLAAGAVLVMAFVSAVIGLMIFLPKIF